MGEEFHQNRVQTACCLICGPTTDHLKRISTNCSLNNALNMFIGSDLGDPKLPPNCCHKCEAKYRTYYQKNRRKFVRPSLEIIAKHKSELQKKNLYPIFPYTPHTDTNCKVCEANLSIEDSANKLENSGPVHNIPPSYSHPTRNRNEPKRLGDWNMGEEKINKKMKSNEENGHVQEMETNVMQIESRNTTEMSTSKIFLSQSEPLLKPINKIMATNFKPPLETDLLPKKNKNVTELNFTWYIDNFSSLMRNNVGDGIMSDTFSIDKTQWHFLLHPNGTNEECKHFVSLWLFSDNKEEIFIEYQVSIGEKLLKSVELNLVKPRQCHEISKLVSHIDILDKNLLDKNGQLILTAKISKDTSVETISKQNKKVIHHTCKSQFKISTKLIKKDEKSPIPQIQDPLAIETSTIQNETVIQLKSNHQSLIEHDHMYDHRLMNSKVFLSPRDPHITSNQQESKPTVIAAKTINNFIIPNKTYSKTPLILKQFNPSTVPVPHAVKTKKAVIIAPKGTIDLPTKLSNPVTTVITLRFPENKASNSSPCSFNNEVTPELPDDTIDPLKQAADEASPHEPVGELLKIVTNLPLSDQVLFIKLLVLQLNDDMLSLVRKLVNTLQHEKLYEEEIDNVLDLIPGCDVIDVKEELYGGNQEDDDDENTSFNKEARSPDSDQAPLMSMTKKKETVDLVNSESRVVCDQCPKTFKSETVWRRHMKIHEEEKSQEKNIQCDECPMRFHFKDLFMKHKYYKHNSVFCEKCGKKCPNGSELKRHDRIIHCDPTKPKPFPCDKCPSAFMTETRLRLHRMSHDVVKQFACDKCERSFTQKWHLKEHMNKHGTEKKYKCKDCSKCFKFKATLFTHNRTNHSSDLPFECDICFKRFPITGRLKVHKLSHLDKSQWPFVCEKCGKRFKTKKEMVIHIQRNCPLPRPRRTKTAEEVEELKKNRNLKKKVKNCIRVDCDLCGKSISRKHMKYHIIIKHSSVRPFPCEECNQCYATKHSLEQHKQSHSKQFNCEQCLKSFSRNSILSAHLRTHTGEKPYSCDECPKTFSFKRDLKKHKEKYHKKNEENTNNDIFLSVP